MEHFETLYVRAQRHGVSGNQTTMQSQYVFSFEIKQLCY